MKHRTGALLVILSALTFLVCVNGETTGCVAAPQPSPRFEIVAIELALENHEPSVSTILEVEVRIDNIPIGSRQFTTAVSFAGPFSSRLDLDAGPHTVSFRIVQQTSSPNLYAVSPLGVIVAIDDGVGTKDSVIELYPNDPLDPYNALLATGESIVIPFDLQ